MASTVAEKTQADAALMASKANKFDEVNDSLQIMLSTLMSELSALQGSWHGLGAAAFEQAKEQYSADLRSLSRALTETAGAIRRSGVGYDTSDADAASRVGRTGGSFNLPL